VLLADGVVLVELGEVLVELCPTANPAHRTRAENVYSDFFILVTLLVSPLLFGALGFNSIK